MAINANYKTGSPKSLSRLLRLTYDELLEMAVRFLRRERRSHALQHTELVHEAYLRLNRTGPVEFHNKAHFFAAASRAMRRILIDGARRANAQKRGGAWQRVDLGQVKLAYNETAGDLLSFRQAMRRLRRLDAQLHRIVEMRLLRRYSIREIAERLNMGQSTVRRDWAIARTWLRQQIEGPLP
jgi:RNA polymerase sigma factor (TIGR02999 family)